MFIFLLFLVTSSCFAGNAFSFNPPTPLIEHKFPILVEVCEILLDSEIEQIKRNYYQSSIREPMSFSKLLITYNNGSTAFYIYPFPTGIRNRVNFTIEHGFVIARIKDFNGQIFHQEIINLE